jgi:hypothetical protein
VLFIVVSQVEEKAKAGVGLMVYQHRRGFFEKSQALFDKRL